MRAFLSTIGSRGDVQPLLALAAALRARGHDATVCAAPDFGDWVAGHGFGFVPIGPPLRSFPLAAPATAPLTAERARELAAGTVRAQFATLAPAVRDHDVLVAATVLQLAAPSVAAAAGIPHVFVAYAPTVLPSPAHPPAQMRALPAFDLPEADNRALWAAERAGWRPLFGAALDEERAKLGLPPVDDVYAQVLGPRPWLAADPTLGPAGPAEGLEITQTGAWRLADPTPLPSALEAFLAAGEPPVYFGFGSMRDRPEVGQQLLAAARAVGRRAIVSRGWGGLAPAPDGRDDWIAVDDLAHDALLPRVAAVVHHGGAGTTHAAAVAGRPQVVVPHNYDQGYWAWRVGRLGVGVALPTVREIDVDTVVAGLRAALAPAAVDAAAALSSRIVRDGADVAADRLIALVG